MLIPAIDLQGGRVVQLVQGKRLAIASDDIDGWIARFARFPLIQVIDLDAAMGTGQNEALVRYVCGRLTCQVGGGVRTPADAERALVNGAHRVIAGSALVGVTGARPLQAAAFASAVGRDRLVAAVDSRAGRVVIDGWQTLTAVPVEDAMRALEPHVSGFLATLVDDEGLMRGVNLAVARRLRAVTATRLIVAGGVSSVDELLTLHAAGIDAVAGMAVYTGAIRLEDLPWP
ncbi:MAG TPA: HisA/HisF-related TIM barrel protein [Vicinamibacterales bacterium]|nr:HisA/HisF-related TIM barrel protein [Vicinamibacterales bacterium]